MNKVILMGRLTRDPDVRYSAGGGDQQAYARYTVAVDRRVRRDNNDPNAQTADFISCVAFGRSAQFAEQCSGRRSGVCREQGSSRPLQRRTGRSAGSGL